MTTGTKKSDVNIDETTGEVYDELKIVHERRAKLAAMRKAWATYVKEFMICG